MHLTRDRTYADATIEYAQSGSMETRDARATRRTGCAGNLLAPTAVRDVLRHVPPPGLLVLIVPRPASGSARCAGRSAASASGCWPTLPGAGAGRVARKAWRWRAARRMHDRRPRGHRAGPLLADWISRMPRIAALRTAGRVGRRSGRDEAARGLDEGDDLGHADAVADLRRTGTAARRASGGCRGPSRRARRRRRARGRSC